MVDQILPTPSDVNSQIQQASQAIRNGDTASAKRIVAELIKNTKDNADVWYLYAFLLDDATKKRQALDRALSIDPEHVRAKELSAKLQTDDLVGDLFAPTPGTAPMASYQPPPIIVNVNQDNHANVSATAIAGGAAVTKTNQLAMFIGFIAAFFFGIFGLAHLLNGKIGGAVVYFFGGILWLIVAGLMVGLTAGIGACLAIPIHFYLAYSWSKKGATS